MTYRQIAERNLLPYSTGRYTNRRLCDLWLDYYLLHLRNGTIDNKASHL